MSTSAAKLLSRSQENPMPGGSAIWPIIEHFLNDEFIRLDNANITPWAFFHSGEMKVTDFYGKGIAYNGLSFQISPTLVFWNGYIEPFLQDIASRAIDLTLKAARERNIKVRDPLLEVQGQLYSLIRKTFDHVPMPPYIALLLLDLRPGGGSPSRHPNRHQNLRRCW